MCNANEKNREVFESIAVIAIYTPNVVEIPFEKNGERLYVQFEKYLLQCSDIMRRAKGCLDIIIHNTYICGIFDCDNYQESERVIDTARCISHISQKLKCEADEAFEHLYFGIGVAKGGAVRFTLRNKGIHRAKYVWLGKVLEDARSLAQIAFCDGRDLVRVTEAVFSDIP